MERNLERISSKHNPTNKPIANTYFFQVHHPRADYRELLELACIFLGGTPPRGIKFKKPGATHHARWLSKAIYSLKMYLFRDQFTLKRTEIEGLREICVFVVLFYVKAWFQAPSAVAAPQCDLNLLQELIKYLESNVKIAKAALSKLTGHLWYLTEKTVAFGFFDKKVPREVKIKMRDAMENRSSTGLDLNRIKFKEREYKTLLTKDLSDFVTQESKFIFDLYGISMNFLEKDPSEWEDDVNFQCGLKVVSDLKVVNDVAERGVALIQEFNTSFTKDEDQKQFALQLVKKHRQKYPARKIKNYMKD